MKNLFIYTTPHPAHDALADSLNCKKIKSFQGIPFFGRFFNLVAVDPHDNYDIVLTESISRDLVAGAAYKYWNPKSKLVALLTDPKLYELKTAPLADKMLTMWALDKADLLLVGSTMMYNLVPPPFREKTRLFYPGIKDIELYKPLKAKHGSNFVFVGRIDNYKGTDLLPGLLNRFRYYKNNAKLYVAGDGPNADLFKNRIQDHIFYLGKTKNALFMHNVASIYVSAARFEPSGVAILEAMAQGLVPIITRGVGYADIVGQIDQRLVVSSEDEAASIANTLINNPKEWARLSKLCKFTAMKYSYKYMIAEFKKELQSNQII